VVERLSSSRYREGGQTTTEFALLVAVTAIALIAAIVFLRSSVSGVFRKSSESVGTFTPPPVACASSYSGGCVPPYPPDIDCSDLRALGLSNITVTGPDPHHLDPDGDGIACD
jgi:Flp pilus assembly pilin Flp